MTLELHKDMSRHYLCEVKTFIFFCGKFIQDIMDQILPESITIYVRHDKNIVMAFVLGRRINLL